MALERKSNKKDAVKKETEKGKVEIVDDRQKVTFIKIGRGSFHFNGTIIKPNQKFQAYPEEIPSAFRDLIKPVNPIDAKVFEEKPKTAPNLINKSKGLKIEGDEDFNAGIDSQMEDLKGINFEDEAEVKELRDGLVEAGKPELAELPVEQLFDACVEMLTAEYRYKVVDRNGKALTGSVTHAEAEKLLENLK